MRSAAPVRIILSGEKNIFEGKNGNDWLEGNATSASGALNMIRGLAGDDSIIATASTPSSAMTYNRISAGRGHDGVDVSAHGAGNMFGHLSGGYGDDALNIDQHSTCADPDTVNHIRTQAGAGNDKTSSFIEGLNAMALVQAGTGHD